MSTTGRAPDLAAGRPAVGTPEPDRLDGTAAGGDGRGLSWPSAYIGATVVLDAAGALGAGVLAQHVFDGAASLRVGGQPSRLGLSAVVAAAWIGLLGLTKVFERRTVGVGNDEYRRILRAAGKLLAAVVIVPFFLHRSSLSRIYVASVVTLAPCSAILVHWLARRVLHHLRRTGRCRERTVVVGCDAHVDDLAEHLAQAPHVGFEIVGACASHHRPARPATARSPGGTPPHITSVPVVTDPEGLASWVRAGNADVVIVADAAVLGPGGLRRLGWDLEGSGIDLIVAPSVTTVAGPRISVRPVAGLPLLHVEEPRFDGPSRVTKTLVERAIALLALITLAPLLALLALAVRLSSPGQAFYRQVRVGKGGSRFTMLKFRTMVDGAHTRKGDLVGDNEVDGPMFKIRDDPRVTPIGRWLRRLSLDELPQLAHVVSGKMSIVGPRPPLPEEVAAYGEDARRRLLVRPGLTGLWQVSGRSELSWMESLRLDLHYVENWSLSLDLVILLKTVLAVVRGRGAY